MASLDLVMPMAGRGSRFQRQGYAMPKPLVPLFGRPFFVWAVESVRSKVPVDNLVFVVLREHVQAFHIDREIRERYPQARLVVIDEVTSGAAETAAIGIEATQGDRPIAVNDCDHAFDASGLSQVVSRLQEGESAGALLGFPSSNAAYSYVKFDDGGRVVGTVEKQVASPYAIAGCYLFSSREEFAGLYKAYRTQCTYAELFVSGMFNLAVEQGREVAFHRLLSHVPFGTPEELALVTAESLRPTGQPEGS